MLQADKRPGIVVSIPTSGDLLQWHNHLHVLVTDGAFSDDRSFHSLTTWDADALMLPRAAPGATGSSGTVSRGNSLASSSLAGIRASQLKANRTRRHNCNRGSGGLCGPKSSTTWASARLISSSRTSDARRDCGGPEQRLGETNTAAAWSPDGKTLAVSHHPGWEDGGGIFLLSLETGKRTRLTTPPPGARDNFPCFSPDGKLVAFMRDSGPADIFVVPANGGATKQITAEKNRVFGLAWTSDSREVVYAGIRQSGRGMWRVSASGGAPERVPINGQRPSSLDISRQGNKLVWTESSGDSNIWMFRGPGFAGRAVPGKFGAAVMLPSSSIHEDHSPDSSPDGQQLVFASGRTGADELWVRDADGNNAVRLTTQGGPTGSPRWSPDGKWIACDSYIGGDGNIYVISARGGPWRRLTHENTAETQPAWSRDGQSIYFKSNRSGSDQIYKMAAAGGDAKQITLHGGFEGFESPDGSLFYYTKARGVYGIYTVPANGGEEKRVPELSRAGYWRSWSMVKEGICFMTKEEGAQQTIRFFSFATRRVTPLVTVNNEALWWQPGLALSSDGRRLLFARLEHGNDEIMLMENFR